MYTNPIEASNKNITDSQHQALYKGVKNKKAQIPARSNTKVPLLMASDDNQDINHKTSQVDWATSLLLQASTKIRTQEQKHPSCAKRKLRCGNGIPKGNPSRLWFRISRHHQNQNFTKATATKQSGNW